MGYVYLSDMNDDPEYVKQFRLFNSKAAQTLAPRDVALAQQAFGMIPAAEQATYFGELSKTLDAVKLVSMSNDLSVTTSVAVAEKKELSTLTKVGVGMLLASVVGFIVYSNRR